jgi:hypothetical protein
LASSPPAQAAAECLAHVVKVMRDRHRWNPRPGFHRCLSRIGYGMTANIPIVAITELDSAPVYVDPMAFSRFDPSRNIHETRHEYYPGLDVNNTPGD